MPISDSLLRDNAYIYMNETVDKLTVNKVFSKLKTIAENQSINTTIDPSSVVHATEYTYGIAKKNTGEFLYQEPSDNADVYNSTMLSMDTFRDYVNKLHVEAKSSEYANYSVKDAGKDGENQKWSGYKREENTYCGWIRETHNTFDTIVLPNGINLYTISYDIGLGNLSEMFNLPKEAIKKSVFIPTEITSFDSVITLTDGDRFTIDTLAAELSSKYEELAIRSSLAETITSLKSLNNQVIGINYSIPPTIQLKHHDCNYTKFSSYNQSYVEVVFSFSLSVADFISTNTLSSKYLIDRFTCYNPSVTENEQTVEHTIPPRLLTLFKQKPIVMPQVSLYTDNSKPKTLVGATLGSDDSFSDSNTITTKELTTITTNDIELSPITATIILKDYHNKYNSSGVIVDNILSFDVSMKFMAGGVFDSSLLGSLLFTNALAKVQIALIGI